MNWYGDFEKLAPEFRCLLSNGPFLALTEVTLFPKVGTVHTDEIEFGINKMESSRSSSRATGSIMHLSVNLFISPAWSEELGILFIDWLPM